MSPKRFDHLLELVKPITEKKDTNLRKSMSVEERLAITLATGDSQQSLSFSYRLGKATMSKIISETCKAIYTVLKDPYLTPPDSKEEWLEIFKNFEEVWNMPHVIECIDGKHIRVECPKLSGTLYYNYKGFFSIVLMALCGANYCFTLFDLGQYGSNNDSGILANSEIGKMFEEDQLNVSPDCKLSEDDEHLYRTFCLEMRSFRERNG